MGLTAYLLVGLLLFTLGMITVLLQRNLVVILVGIELILAAANLNFMAFNYYVSTDPAVGQAVVLVTIGLAAAEVAIFLSILMVLYRARHEIDAGQLRDSEE